MRKIERKTERRQESERERERAREREAEGVSNSAWYGWLGVGLRVARFRVQFSLVLAM